VTFPSLYVFGALVGSPLLVPALLRLLIASLAVMVATLASIGPIVGFFSFTTTSYEFIIVLNVIVFSIAGLLGSAFLLQTLRRLSIVASRAEQGMIDPGGEQVMPPVPDPEGPLDQPAEKILSRHVKTVFRIWVLVFGLVGAQMSWVMRPFIGHPGEPFTWFRHPGSNFFVAVAHVLAALFS
jgi:hypothetical protein